MSEYGKVQSFRFPEDTRREMAELHDCFAPAFQKDSQLVRFAITFLYSICCCGKLSQIGEVLQRLLGRTLYDEVPSVGGGKPGPEKLGLGDQARAGKRSLSRRLAASEAKAVLGFHASWSVSSLRRIYGFGERVA